MFGIGMTELVVILGVALIVFGPTRLPELARSLGKAMNEFRRASTDLRQTFREAVDDPPPAPAAVKPTIAEGAPVAEPPTTAVHADATATPQDRGPEVPSA